MVEVRMHVRLTNAADQALVRRCQLPPGEVRSYETDALVDTGAVRCALPSFVAEDLGLDRLARYVAQYADGRLEEVDVTEGFVLGKQIRLSAAAP